VYYSVGGGFIVDFDMAKKDAHLGEENLTLPFPFKTGDELLNLCRQNQMKISQVVLENEKTWRTIPEIKQGLLNIWNVMKGCIDRGCRHEGILPGGLNVKRRATGLWHSLQNAERTGKKHPAQVMEWVSLWALAVNEENAAGGRVVTAPTNGAAG